MAVPGATSTVRDDPAPRRRLGPVAEAAAALGLGLLLAVATRRPRDLASSVPADARDPVLLSWVLAWPGHALTSGKALWDANAFAPTPSSLAFTDPLLGYLPLGLVGESPGAALVRYNVALLLAGALAFAGAWVLVRQLGLGRAAALVAAVAFAVSPWRVSQLNHLQILSSGGIPLALAMLARGHGLHLRSGRGPLRPGWALAGWAVATWQLSIGFGLGLQLAYLLAVCTTVAAGWAALRWRRGHGLPPRRLLAADAAGLVLFVGGGLLLAAPFLQAADDHPESRRELSEVQLYSPPARAFVTAPADSWLWGRWTAAGREDVFGLNEKTLLPGAAVTVLAVVGLGLPGPWSRRRRVVLAGATVTLAVLAMGTAGPFGGRLYLLLYDHLPGYEGIRTPSRLVTTAWLGLALLAAHGVTALQGAIGRTGGSAPARQATATGVAGALAAVALLEGLDTAPLTPVRPPPSVRLADLPQPVLVLPSEQSFDQLVMLWSTDGFPRVVNGVSGFDPQELVELREAASRLPDPAALARLRRSGVASLLLVADALPGTRYEGVGPASLAGVDGLTVTDRDDVAVVRLTPAPRPRR